MERCPRGVVMREFSWLTYSKYALNPLTVVVNGKGTFEVEVKMKDENYLEIQPLGFEPFRYHKWVGYFLVSLK